MDREPAKKSPKGPQKPSRFGLKQTSLWLIFAFVLVSWLIHLASLVGLQHLPNLQAPQVARKEPVKIKIMPKQAQNEAKKNEKKEKEKQKDLEASKILESKLSETKPPDKADYLGQQNHKALKETKLSEKREQSKAADPGAQGAQKPSQSNAVVKRVQPQDKAKEEKREKQLAEKKKRLLKQQQKQLKKSQSYDNGLAVLKPMAPRNAYEKLLNNSMDQMQGQTQKGYQDYINDKIEIGSAIDLNTQEYRYIGYFTSMRKAIELTWIYPSAAARRGLYGQVNVLFTIQADGKVSRVTVLDSSGHAILDEAIVDAIRLAAPFAPLPEGFGKKQLSVRGTFNYILN